MNNFFPNSLDPQALCGGLYEVPFGQGDPHSHLGLRVRVWGVCPGDRWFAQRVRDALCKLGPADLFNNYENVENGIIRLLPIDEGGDYPQRGCDLYWG